MEWLSENWPLLVLLAFIVIGGGIYILASSEAERSAGYHGSLLERSRPDSSSRVRRHRPDEASSRRIGLKNEIINDQTYQGWWRSDGYFHHVEGERYWDPKTRTWYLEE